MMAWRIGEILDIDAQLEWIREAGFDGAGLHADPGESGRWQGIDPFATDAEARARLRRTLARFAMCEIHAPYESVLAAGSLPASTEALLAVLDFAGDVGASVVTVHADPSTQISEADLSAWWDSLKRLNARAAECQVLIGLEVTQGFEWIAQLGLANIGVTLDVGHMHLDGGRPLEPFGGIGDVVRRIGHTLVHLHVHDYDGCYDHIEPGTGRIDLVGVLRALKDVGYERGLCLELDPDRVSPEGILRSRVWLREQMRALGPAGTGRAE
jgi:sugar phosphate isomerase/epimerase